MLVIQLELWGLMALDLVGKLILLLMVHSRKVLREAHKGV